MLEGFCNNALLTKMRAMNGSRLTSYDYDELLKKQCVSDVVAYLKGTYYSEVLSEVKDSIKREELRIWFA